MKLTFLSVLALLFLVAEPLRADLVVAQDSYDISTGVVYGGSSGSGFGNHTDFGGTGGIYFESGSRKIDGAGSLGSYSNGTVEEWGRSVTNTSLFSGFSGAKFAISLRFDIPNSNNSLKGFNVKSALGSSFGDNELLSLGLKSDSGNNKLLLTSSVLDSTSLDFGSTDLRGPIIDVAVDWSLSTGLFNLSATVRGGATKTASGTLKTTPGTFIPGAIGFIHSDVGGSGNNVYFDNLTLSAVPEPSAFLFGGLVCGALGVSYCLLP